MNRRSYQFEFQPQLIEESVLRAIAGSPKESLFRQERDRIYEQSDEEGREHGFQELHERWFESLGLTQPLRQVFEQWPILKRATHRCLVTKARSQKDEGAELYVAGDRSGTNERRQRSIIIQCMAEMLCQPDRFLAFLRHELLHIVDMLDPDFGYQPVLPPSSAGPTYDLYLQRRYRVLWDVTIAGRLLRECSLDPSIREHHLSVFRQTFVAPEAQQRRAFSHFFDSWPHTHAELLAYVQNSNGVSADQVQAGERKGFCALCRLPSHSMIDPSVLSPDLVARIQQDRNDWSAAELICRQCFDLYSSHSADFSKKS